MKTLYFISAIFGFCLLVYLFCAENKAPILGAIGIILSAFIASFTVKETIDENRKKGYEESINQIIAKLKQDYIYNHQSGELKSNPDSFPQVSAYNLDNNLLYELQLINYYLEKLGKILDKEKFNIMINAYANRLGYINNFSQTKMRQDKLKTLYKPFDVELKKFLFNDGRENIGINSTNQLTNSTSLSH